MTSGHLLDCDVGAWFWSISPNIASPRTSADRNAELDISGSRFGSRFGSGSLETKNAVRLEELGARDAICREALGEVRRPIYDASGLSRPRQSLETKTMRLA